MADDGTQSMVDEITFETLKDTLECLEMGYEPGSDGFVLETVFRDGHGETPIRASVGDGVVRFSAYLPLTVPRERQMEAAWDLNRINSTLGYGFLLLHPDDGRVSFESAHIFGSRVPRSDLFTDLIVQAHMVAEESGRSLSGLIET